MSLNIMQLMNSEITKKILLTWLYAMFPIACFPIAHYSEQNSSNFSLEEEQTSYKCNISGNYK